MTQQFWCRKQTCLPLLVGNSQNLWSWLIKLSRNVGLFVRLRGPQYPHNLLMEPFWIDFSYGLCSSHYWLSWWCNRVVPIDFRPSNSSKGFWFQTQLVKLTARHSKSCIMETQTPPLLPEVIVSLPYSDEEAQRFEICSTFRDNKRTVNWK